MRQNCQQEKCRHSENISQSPVLVVKTVKKMRKYLAISYLAGYQVHFCLVFLAVVLKYVHANIEKKAPAFGVVKPVGRGLG